MSFSQQVMQGQQGSVDQIPSGYRKAQLQQFTPEQMKLFGEMFGHLGKDSYTSRLASGDQSMYDEMEAPALKQFSQLQGNIASRFSGGGGGPGALSARRSSGFQNTMGQAATDFAGQLQSQRQGLRRQAIQDLMGMSHTLLNQRPWETAMAEKRQKAPGFLEQVGGTFANSFAEGAGDTLSGKWFGD